MLIDLHVHTARGSSDSSLTRLALVEAALGAGLDGVCLTEHSLLWNPRDLAEAQAGTDLRLYAALEVETDAGHVLLIGGDGYAPGIRRLKTLAEHAARAGAAVVLAHPFRHHADPPPGRPCILTASYDGNSETAAEAAEIPALSIVHALEAVNGATSDADNAFAAQVAGVCGLPVTGGSDAHSPHGIGIGVTEIPGEPRDAGELAEALRSGDVRAAHGPPAAGALRYV